MPAIIEKLRKQIDDLENEVVELISEVHDIMLNSVSKEYDSFKEAEYDIVEVVGSITDELSGEYRTGETEYIIHFTVDGVEYAGVVEVEYDRHDKTYYYVSDINFKYELI